MTRVTVVPTQPIKTWNILRSERTVYAVSNSLMETKQAVLPLSAPFRTSIILSFGNRHNHITVFDETVFVSSMTLYLQAMSLFIQSGLVGKHPKPFERAAPAGRSTSAVSILLTSTKCFPAAYIFVTPRKHTILPPSAKWSATHRQHKAPRLRQRVSEGFSCCLWVFSLPWCYPRSDGHRRGAVTPRSQGSSQQ